MDAQPAPAPTARCATVVVDVLSCSRLVCLGVRALLGEHPDQVRVFDHDPHRLRPAPPGVVVLYDVVTGDAEGSTSVRDIAGRGIPVVALVRPGNRRDVSRARGVGARDCVTSEASGPELTRTLRTAAQRAAATRGADGSMVDTTTRRWSAAGLSGREEQVVALLAHGLDNDEIAASLSLSRDCVRQDLRTSYRKIGARTRPQAVLWALGEPRR